MDRNDALLSDWRQRALALEAEVAKAVIGQARVIRHINTAVFARVGASHSTAHRFDPFKSLSNPLGDSVLRHWSTERFRPVA